MIARFAVLALLCLAAACSGPKAEYSTTLQVGRSVATPGKLAIFAATRTLPGEARPRVGFRVFELGFGETRTESLADPREQGVVYRFEATASGNPDMPQVHLRSTVEEGGETTFASDQTFIAQLAATPDAEARQP